MFVKEKVTTLVIKRELLIVLLTFLLMPFISSEYFGNYLVFSIVCLLTLLIYSFNVQLNLRTRNIFILCYLLCMIVLNLIRTSFYVSFFYEVISLLIIYSIINWHKASNLFTHFNSLFLKVIVSFTIISFFFLNFTNSFHPITNLNIYNEGYSSGLSNYFLGRYFSGFIPGVLRYSWFFAETSYLAFYFGLSTLVLFELKKIKSNVFFLLIVFNLFFYQSLTFLSAFSFYFIIKIFMTLGFRNRLLLLFIVLTVMYLVTFSDYTETVDTISKLYLSSEGRSFSYSGRVERVQLVYAYLQDINILQFFFGNGFSVNSKLVGEYGISNGLLRIFHDYGFVGISFFIITIYKLIGSYIPIFAFFIIGGTSINVLLVPLVPLIIFPLIKMPAHNRQKSG